MTLMIDETLQEQAALYAAGAMSARERAQFDLIVESYDDLRTLVARLEEVSALATISAGRLQPNPALRTRILAQLNDRAQLAPPSPEGFVITCAGGFVRWVNPAFTEMCGYSLEELRGRKLGPLLQGEKTDRTVAERMRHAVHQRQPCHENILNYHKNGTPYWVEIVITPLSDDAGQPQWFVARERELPELLAA
jgi:PAS domain S-box-containing protein